MTEPPPPQAEPPQEPGPRSPLDSPIAVVSFAFLGMLAFPVLNLMVVLVAIAGSNFGSSNQDNSALIVAAVFLGVVAFGGGGALCLNRIRSVKALGIGLMVGWALMSILTAGFCTGLNPSMYQ